MALNDASIEEIQYIIYAMGFLGKADFDDLYAWCFWDDQPEHSGVNTIDPSGIVLWLKNRVGNRGWEHATLAHQARASAFDFLLYQGSKLPGPTTCPFSQITCLIAYHNYIRL
jgi:hypothetical protein